MEAATSRGPATRESVIGKLVADRYMVVDVLGRGGFGAVYKADDTHLSTAVALKILHFTDDPRIIAMLEREATNTAMLRHPSIVQVLDFGKTEGLPFLVMDYVDGMSLKQMLSLSGALEIANAVGIFEEIGSALEYAHGCGLVHLDVKPSNILIDRNGRVLLSDFGVALFAGQAADADRGFIAGTLAYMSPEQSAGKAVDSRSDVYSLAVVLYEMLTGSRPPVRQPTNQIRKPTEDTGNGVRPSLRSVNPNVTEELEQVIDRALATDAVGRFGSVSKFVFAVGTAIRQPNRASPVANTIPVANQHMPQPTSGPANSSRGVILRGGLSTILHELIGDPDSETCPFVPSALNRDEVPAVYMLRRSGTAGNWPAGKKASLPGPSLGKPGLVEDAVEIPACRPLPVAQIPVLVAEQAASPRREIVIQCPDGQIKTVPLQGHRFTVGRSSAAELCFPDDAGLSRQHMVLERDGDDWTVQDLGSKNGTLVNNIRLREKLRLKPGDRIAAGHLAIVFDDESRAALPAEGVVVFESDDADPSSTSSIFTSLGGALSSQTIGDRPAQHRAKQVQALIRAGQELAGRGTLADLFPLILDLAIEGVGAQRGVVMTIEGDHLEVKANKGEGFHISSAVRDRVINEKASVLVRDAQLDEAFRERMSIVEQKVRTLMAVPLQTETRTIGLIYVDSPNMFRAFTNDDLSLLTVLANVAAIRIEHARLSEVEEMERRMARDLEQAAELQRSFLPSGAPKVAGVDLAGYNVPCRTVGSDYYDFFTYPNGRVAMVLGDVSGKGMKAALMMMGLQARVQVLADEPQNLAAVMNRLNRITCQNCPSNRFITFFFCVLDPATGALAFCNAGHNAPVIVRANGAVEYLDDGGPPLGILSIANYSEYRARLEPGDGLAIYSDGVTEANNAKEEEFGDERFAAVLTANRHKSAAEIVAAVNQALTDFAAGSQPADDLTIIVARRIKHHSGEAAAGPGGGDQ